jgi:hypothetical protein
LRDRTHTNLENSLPDTENRNKLEKDVTDRAQGVVKLPMKEELHGAKGRGIVVVYRFPSLE